LILDETELEVRINVSNLADSAYEAQLFIVHQAGVSYVATKKPVSGNQECLDFAKDSTPSLSLLPDECHLQQLQHHPSRLQSG